MRVPPTLAILVVLLSSAGLATAAPIACAGRACLDDEKVACLGTWCVIGIVDVKTEGDAHGTLLAVSGDGNANGGTLGITLQRGNSTGLLALAGNGNASGYVALALQGEATADLLATSLRGDATACRQDEQTFCAALSGTGDAAACQFGFLCAALTGTGHAHGDTAVSGCDVLALAGLPEACISRHVGAWTALP